MKAKLDKRVLLERLNRIAYEKDPDTDRDSLDAMNLARVLLQLARIEADTIYTLARGIVAHLRGFVPDPELGDTDELEQQP